MLQTQPRAGDSANPRQWLARAATLHGIVEGVAHREAQPTGVEALDAWLPLGGLPKGALTE
ncbi:MAG: hypothetical protein KDB07_13430, partial [Planctomycetes bacterium]|nr:hypothetical protein [Planctomycetota bacterium]